VELTQWKEAEFIDTLAEANYASGSYQEAVRVQLIALKLDPQNPELQEHMARYRKAAEGVGGGPAQRIEDLKSIRNVSPPAPSPHFSLRV
jgi:hypothetical protein